MLSARYPSQMLMKLEFSAQIFKKNTGILNFMKILSVEDELFHVDERNNRQKDRQTDRHDEVNSHFFTVLSNRL